MFRFAPLMVLLCAFAACSDSDSGSGSGTSGVDSTKKVTELSSSEREDLCEYMTEAQGGVHSKDCGDGITLTVETTAECVANIGAFTTSCTATVDDAEACAEAAGDDLCNLLSSPACSFIFTCSGDDGAGL